jgi:hypothetical protein
MALEIIPEVKDDEPVGPISGIKTAMVFVEGSNAEELYSNDARRLAYEERDKRGLPNAGIEAVGGAYPVDSRDKKGAPLDPKSLATMSTNPDLSRHIKYRRAYKLTQGII